MAKRPRDRSIAGLCPSRSTKQPWPKGHACAFNQTTLAKRPCVRVQPSTIQPSTIQPSTKQPWPKGHACAFNQTTFNLQPNNLQPSTIQPSTFNLGLLATRARTTIQPKSAQQIRNLTNPRRRLQYD
ncbi:MAG: hypothetical protein F6K65_18660 [Moorea sp. SIO3C2]|nr:hypothetical protein [Moorena sp. SIO3C2]